LQQSASSKRLSTAATAKIERIGTPGWCRPSSGERSPVLAQTILTVEARHDHDKNIPSLNKEDVMYEGMHGLR
jgi:hypothetical protein